ncbi:hypothetical protein, conserved in T. vivax [Trypanosoma vivax Y486]|uniref:Uncharacterized protein n=1 Tax=Trypanosoma vivax (strain Y486) TaxID=1055687 RepID=F9WUB2_TRYVY|nr:hypothetical protein, conserved in T. vivax [Trypanosoma vivax Y486]|eukprot:CCD21160.1 hypothetical protein, conserved in T. vivax [Trypanosoma vivax Y486]
MDIYIHLSLSLSLSLSPSLDVCIFIHTDAYKPFCNLVLSCTNNDAQRKVVITRLCASVGLGFFHRPWSLLILSGHTNCPRNNKPQHGKRLNGLPVKAPSSPTAQRTIKPPTAVDEVEPLPTSRGIVCEERAPTTSINVTLFAAPSSDPFAANLLYAFSAFCAFLHGLTWACRRHIFIMFIAWEKLILPLTQLPSFRLLLCLALV